jgi:hypothetical protein
MIRRLQREKLQLIAGYNAQFAFMVLFGRKAPAID